MSAELFSNPVLSENPETNETFARRDAFSQIRKADLFNLIGTFGPDTVIDIRKTHESIGILMCVLFYKSISFPWKKELIPANRNRNSYLRSYSKNKLLRQIGIGALLAAAMSLVFTVLPIALGFKDMVGGTSYKYAWQFTFEFFYCILGVAIAEEIIFRGYIFRKLLEIKSSRWMAIIVS